MLLFPLVAGCSKENGTQTLTWTGRWEKAQSRGSYESFIRMDNGRIARFMGVLIVGLLKEALLEFRRVLILLHRLDGSCQLCGL